ncbi:MAG TPA: VOC family protein [Ferrovibrio sp.]|jgi:PhnB protein|uniref:VOC family protein n=1 Tax=Ferrovibrio sp. TaxID=1917215 RepID=UPI002B4B1244|nr:VOC family protein [Ferrovibrio sp.]HLT79024.1 VOC family protein [Ferrovibrio sp.]
MVSAIPDGFTAVTPYLTITDAAKAIDYYRRAFGAEEVYRLMAPDGERVVHAELRIGDARLMLADSFPEWNTPAPARDGAGVGVHLYVEDVDAVMAAAEKHGARILMPPMDAFWGDRYGKLLDPYGVTWGVATHIRDMTPDEIAKAAKEALGN